MQNDDSHVVPLTLLAQSAVSIGLAAAVWLAFGAAAGLSVLLGGAAAVVPNAFLAARLLATGAGSSARALLRSAWIGVIGKLVLTALAFGAIFALVRPLAPAAVFAGFIAAQCVVFAALLSGGGPARLTESTTKS